MRIGEVNRDNYADFLKPLGGKTKELSKEECDAISVKAGYALEGTFTTSGDDSWKEIVPVSGDIKNLLVAKAKEQFLSKSGGKRYGAADGDEIGAIIQKHLKTLPPSDRKSVGWTLDKIVSDEQTRLTGIVKANDPTWEQGKPFDKDIAGANYLNVKV